MLNEKSIKAALADQGMTQKDLAGFVDVTPQSVTNWLRGVDFPRPATLLKLATTLKLTHEKLVISDEARPIIAFRKKGSAKTTKDHIIKAVEVGLLLKPLIPYLSKILSFRTSISSPVDEYDHLQMVINETRSRLGAGKEAVLHYEQIISEFKCCGTVLVPVLWGEKNKHENALHIRLPKENITFIFLNLDTRHEDFKFWMAHELAHVYTPCITGTEAGEDYSDAFAGALLFPKACAESAYLEAARKRTDSTVIRVLQAHAEKHTISVNTVYQQVKQFAKADGRPQLTIRENHLHAVRNNKPATLISSIFDPHPPKPSEYLAACKNEFQSEFFDAVRRLIHDKNTGYTYLQQILNVSPLDAKALHEELRN